MKRPIKQYHPPGTPPGTLVPLPAHSRPPRIHLIDYLGEEYTEHEIADADECRRFLARPSTTWIHIQGAASPGMLESLGAIFQLHLLALEDIQNTGQRPKLDQFGDHYFAIVSLPSESGGQTQFQQVSLFFGENYVISFVDGEADPFDPIRRRLRQPGGRLRQHKADYLLYTLLDLVIDQGFPTLEAIGNEIEILEDEILDTPSRRTVAGVHRLKHGLLQLRRMLWPQREVINRLIHDESGLIQERNRVYFQDCYDHCVQIMDLVENYRDMVSGMLDVYLSSVSNRLNEIMRVLTVIATIFIPLTFITGIYGMNFGDHAEESPWAMPELGLYYGYPAVLLIMLAIAALMLVYFKRKDWF